jgi:pimeloyl-ACP methyl ester carboxylesterase
MATGRGLTAAGCAVLVPELPGHGLSSGPALPSIEALADWVPAPLDAAGVGQAILVGHSMGSLVALKCAAGAAGGRALRPDDPAPQPATARSSAAPTASPAPSSAVATTSMRGSESRRLASSAESTVTIAG